jgi:uncharacterized protein YabN with tetrapyrrole methylase and pyrophosphatase domain
LELGEVKERVINIADLARSPHIYLNSSVRKECEVIIDWEDIKEHKKVESRGLRFKP